MCFYCPGIWIFKVYYENVLILISSYVFYESFPCCPKICDSTATMFGRIWVSKKQSGECGAAAGTKTKTNKRVGGGRRVVNGIGLGFWEQRDRGARIRSSRNPILIMDSGAAKESYGHLHTHLPPCLRVTSNCSISISPAWECQPINRRVQSKQNELHI